MRLRELGGNRYRLLASPRVLDENGQRMGGATVSGVWVLPDGSEVDQPAVTRGNGVARFILLTMETGLFEFCVNDITLPGYTYDPTQNVVTCVSQTVP